MFMSPQQSGDQTASDLTAGELGGRSGVAGKGDKNTKYMFVTNHSAH